jgi:hypothetical protein
MKLPEQEAHVQFTEAEVAPVLLADSPDTGAQVGGVQLAENAYSWVSALPVPGGLMYKLVPKGSIS